VYSLNPYSEDERVAVSVLNGNMDGVPGPDAVLLVLDATNLTRYLSLAAPVIALGLPTLALLNMGGSPHQAKRINRCSKVGE